MGNRNLTSVIIPPRTDGKISETILSTRTKKNLKKSEKVKKKLFF